jgi:DinB family protein
MQATADRRAASRELRETIARLAAMPAFLAAAIVAAAGATTRRTRGGDFALVEQACHLRDLDREAFLVRARRMLAETLPELEPFQGDVVAQERNYLAQDAERATRDFAAARAELVTLLAGLTAGELEREALFAGERITLRGLAGMVAAHDGEHRGQIERLLAELAAD